MYALTYAYIYVFAYICVRMWTHTYIWYTDIHSIYRGYNDGNWVCVCIQLTMVQFMIFQLYNDTKSLRFQQKLYLKFRSFSRVVIYGTILFQCWRVTASCSSQSINHYVGKQLALYGELCCQHFWVSCFVFLHPIIATKCPSLCQCPFSCVH